MSSSSGVSMADLISREDLLIVLQSIGVVLPPTTKIPTEELAKKLTAALDGAQDLPEILPSEKAGSELDIQNYPVWPAGEDVARATAQEPTRTMTWTDQLRRMKDSGDLSIAKEDTFKELRQVVLGIGNGVKNGHKHFCLLDEKRVWGVYVRVVQVRKVEEKPLFVVVYKEVFSENNVPFTETDDVVKLFGDDYGRTAAVMSIKTTDLERIVMLKLFRHNAKRLPSGYSPVSKSEIRRLGLNVSFVLPLVPPHRKILGKLSDNAGCDVCGNPKISRCAQCRTAAYCSPACQKADWKAHKATCKLLMGGTWSSIRFGWMPEYMVTLDNAKKVLANCKDGDESRAEDGLPLKYVPEGIHHGTSFLVKIQLSYNTRESMLIYDRQRTFNVLWFRKEDPDLFDDAEIIMGPYLKIYRWARRVSDYELEVCFDKEPSPTPVW